LFTRPEAYDFTPSWSNYPYPDLTMSPCIDAGCPGLLPEPDNTCNDIGAFYFYQQLDIPVALEPEDIRKEAFLAVWTSAYGALGYYLDVALDEGFADMVYDDIDITGDTSMMVEGLKSATTYYYRVKSYNIALTSEYSNTQPATTLMVSAEDPYMDYFSAYTYRDALYININHPANTPGTIWIYDVLGKLLTKQELHPGSNKIDLEANGQVVILKAIVGGTTLQKKLLVD
jgi:hypothetical protein